MAYDELVAYDELLTVVVWGYKILIFDAPGWKISIFDFFVDLERKDIDFWWSGDRKY